MIIYNYINYMIIYNCIIIWLYIYRGWDYSTIKIWVITYDDCNRPYKISWDWWVYRRQAAMDLLVLAQHGSNQAARSALMLGPEKYVPRRKLGRWSLQSQSLKAGCDINSALPETSSNFELVRRTNGTLELLTTKKKVRFLFVSIFEKVDKLFQCFLLGCRFRDSFSAEVIGQEDLYYFFTNHEREDDFFPCLVGGGTAFLVLLLEMLRPWTASGCLCSFELEALSSHQLHQLMFPMKWPFPRPPGGILAVFFHPPSQPCPRHGRSTWTSYDGGVNGLICRWAWLRIAQEFGASFQDFNFVAIATSFTDSIWD